jgi:hypothetical protein
VQAFDVFGDAVNGGSIDRWTEAVNSSGTANAEEVAAA